MAISCKEPRCPNLPMPGGDYCELHECYASGCRSVRAGDDRVYCPVHEAVHYAKTGRYAFRCGKEYCPFPREPSEDYCEEHLSDDAEPLPEERSAPFPLATKILQVLAAVVVLAIGFWGLISWLGSSNQPAGPRAPRNTGAPLGDRPAGETDDDVRELDKILEDRGYR